MADMPLYELDFAVFHEKVGVTPSGKQNRITPTGSSTHREVLVVVPAQDPPSRTGLDLRRDLRRPAETLVHADDRVFVVFET